MIFVPVSLFEYKPEFCPFGHKLWPGMAQVSWKPCLCAPAREASELGRGMGHVCVSCNTCHKQLVSVVFYEPPHSDDGSRPLSGVGDAPRSLRASDTTPRARAKADDSSAVPATTMLVITFSAVQANISSPSTALFEAARRAARTNSAGSGRLQPSRLIVTMTSNRRDWFISGTISAL